MTTTGTVARGRGRLNGTRAPSAIRQAREQAGLSIAAAARKAGLADTTARRIEWTGGGRIASVLAYLDTFGGDVNLLRAVRS